MTGGGQDELGTPSPFFFTRTDQGRMDFFIVGNAPCRPELSRSGSGFIRSFAPVPPSNDRQANRADSGTTSTCSDKVYRMLPGNTANSLSSLRSFIAGRYHAP
jgi:hypothetical protein